MQYPLEAAQQVLQVVGDHLKSDEPADLKVCKLWWGMMQMRNVALTNSLRAIIGDNVFGGPFKGMALTDEAINNYKSPVMLGCYEHELHATFEKIIAKNYTHILNIGCSVGYYAVGLALRMPHVLIDAFDIDANARRKCTDMAQANNVQDRVRIFGEFRGEDFSTFAKEKTLVLMDIESAEMQLLDPAKYPALRKMDIVVELHDFMDDKISKTICDRFAASHDLEIVRNQNQLPDLSGILPDAGSALAPYDHMLLGWEERDGATPWGVFWAKSPN